MKNKIRFHLDEQVDPEIASQLRRRGIDVTTTVEVGLRTSSDESQLNFIRKQKKKCLGVLNICDQSVSDKLRFAQRRKSLPKFQNRRGKCKWIALSPPGYCHPPPLIFSRCKFLLTDFSP